MRDDLTKAELQWRKRPLFKRRRGGGLLWFFLLILLGGAGYAYYEFALHEQLSLPELMETAQTWLERSILR